MKRHTIGTEMAQTRDTSLGIVEPEGGGLSPTPLRMRGGGGPQESAGRDMAS
jgi:hypothetical protein